jgi:hypothetical protein
MDLPNIKLVIQWKATCSLCTLWQRFGRAARGVSQLGTAILLVEKKDTDEERQAKLNKNAATALKKLKAGNGCSSKRKSVNRPNSPMKRPALTDRTATTINGHGTSLTTPKSPSPLPSTQPLDILKEQRWAHYAKRSTIGKPALTKGKSKIVVVSAMDDFINAHLDFECRRVVPMLVFGNDQRREPRVPIAIFVHLSLHCSCSATDDHLKCEESTLDGCLWCKPKIHSICCDLCNPDAFEKFKAVLISKPAKQTAKSHIKAYADEAHGVLPM